MGEKREITVPTLFVPRHGSTAWNTGDPNTERAKGQKDLPLTKEGHKEAIRDAKFLSQYPIAEVHTDRLLRATQSARHIADATGAKYVEDGPLPWDIGYLVGQLRKEIAERIEYYINHPKRPIPEGENYDDLWDRVTSFYSKLLRKAERLDGKAIASVSHSDKMQIVRSFITGSDPAPVEAKTGPAPATIMRVTKRGGKWRISEIGSDTTADEE